MRFISTLSSLFLAYAEEDATYLLQSQVLRAAVSDHQNASWQSCGGSVDGDNNAGSPISGGGPAPGITDSCACKSACDARADCAGWTFSANNRGFTYDGCVLRGNWGSVVRNCNGFCTSAKKAISTCGGVEGENNAGSPISGGGPAPGITNSCACRSACDARTDCVGWTFTANNRGFTYDGCVLRGNWGSVVRNCNGFCASAKKEVKAVAEQYMKCPSYTGLNCPFNDVRKDYANSAAECCDKCHAESQCAGYVFNTKNECWLKRGCQVPRTGARDVISAGPIYRTNSNGNVCPSVSGMNCPFNDIRKDYANSASECCDKCHATSGCRGFVYNTKRECWLKNQCDNPTWGARDVIAAGPIQRTPDGWGVPPPTPVPPPSPPTPAICYGAQPRCAGVACVNGQWMCGPPAICYEAQPRCAGAGCIDGQWMCGGDWCPGTDSPGGETDVDDAKCLDADRGFGPGFSCANTEMYCSSDSGDGLTVGACCQTKCKKEFENKKKNSNAEKKGKDEAERKGKRARNEGSRKKNEKDRKKKRKDTEWNTKRDATETQNKNAEDERKNKRGWKEGQRKNERGWKQNKRQRQAAADQRERARKETRNKNSKKPAKKPISKKDCAKNKKKYAKCKANAKCEKKFKKKGRKEPNC